MIVPIEDMAVSIPDMAVPPDLRVFVSPAQLDQDVANATCQHLIACGRLDNTAAAIAACVERHILAEQTDRTTEVAKGRLQLDETLCLTAIQGSRCDGEDTGRLAAQCGRGSQIPLQALGGQCLLNAECIGGYCARVALALDAGAAPEGCPGVCAPFKALGDPCEPPDDSSCDADTARCDGATMKCVARATAGQACAGPTECQFGLFCDVVAQRCISPTSSGQLGDACNPFESVLTSWPTCGVGLFCKYSFATTPSSGHCATRLQVGANCNPGDTPVGADDQCVDGAACFQAAGAPNPTCQPWAGPGEPCDPSHDSCKDTLYCDGASGKCIAYIPDGQACDPAAPHCLSGSASSSNNCIGSGSGLCAAVKSFGDACAPATDDVLCGAGTIGGFSNGLYCRPVANVCAVRCM
jgi:hypothetical protein